MISAADFQSYAGPGDKNLPMTEISGYQPVSRIGEVVMNAFGTHAYPPLDTLSPHTLHHAHYTTRTCTTHKRCFRIDACFSTDIFPSNTAGHASTPTSCRSSILGSIPPFDELVRSPNGLGQTS